jgi:RNA polymerase sigma-32 factor
MQNRWQGFGLREIPSPQPREPFEVTMGSVFQAESLRIYKENLRSCPQLDRATERDLARRWILGDKLAGEKIVEACLPFVIAVALEYRRWGVPLEDIIQQGNIGLLRAAKKFDPDKDCRLATYAVYWIRAEIREYVVRAYRVVRLGTTKGERRALRAYRTTRETDPVKLAEVSGLTPERVAALMPHITSREVSLDARTNDLPPAVERIEADTVSPEEQACSNEVVAHARQAVSRAMRDLNDRERLIVRERMMSDEPTTLQRLGEVLGVSKERVRQLEERAKEKLRGALAGMREEALAV